ncbi:hypothetical protein [Halobacterium sp. CBA1126]|uniref:hypothetical protein n=1 Tax=Halobacterium sp. CBA1126 TaxID=2668074 RepID=UPI0012FA7115|nr:hypothetical protein [Halobacterium sp. CBA1126]MUV59743.1 hypothetical protein [Halobacterium sp. CBA1126]
MSNREDGKPDLTRSCSLSRRRALALGAAAMGGLAGCNSVSTSGEPSATEATDDDYERTITVRDVSIDTVEFDALLFESITEHDEVEVTVRAYTSPNLDRENQTQVGEATVTQSKELETHSIDWDLPLGYAQNLRFTVEMLSPEAESEEAVTTEFSSTEREREPETERPRETIVPFYNAARDTEMVLLEPPATPEGDWAYSDPFYKTDFWFDSPDESPFNTPEVPEDEYDRDWYDYRNITMTALIRFPNYENITEFEGSAEDVPTHSPAFDWAVVNLDLDAWELVEAVRWNSRATGRIEDGEMDASGVDGVEYAGSNSNSSLELQLDASSQTDPYTAYIITRHAGGQGQTNPLRMSGSRPFTIRAAEELEAAFDNPSFDTLEYRDYHKALALQVFVGEHPFGFATGSYTSTPEETVNKWYKISTGQGESSGNCQDATAMYGGIAVHLLDSTYGIVGMQGNVGYHIMGGLLDLEKAERPYEVWPEHPSLLASGVFTFETDYGTVSPVECTYPDPTIGWKSSDGSDYELLSYLANTSVQSQLLLNESHEPDVNGELRMSAQDPIIQWELQTTEYAVIDDIEDFRAS